MSKKSAVSYFGTRFIAFWFTVSKGLVAVLLGVICVVPGQKPTQLPFHFDFFSFPFLQTEYVHMLNATMCAVSRTICALLENYQTEEGIALPSVLKPLLPEGLDFLKFVKSAPIEEKPEAKKQKKKTKNKQGAQSDTCLEAKMETMDVSKE